MSILKEEPKIGARYAASLDIGTNTVRFLVGEILPDGDFRPVHAGGAITRIGQGLRSSGRLDAGRMDATLSILCDFQKEIAAYRPEIVSAVATSAAREASNGPEFVALAEEKAGLRIEVIDWREEAQRTLLGTFWHTAADPEAETLIFDIGGGSTEFILSQGPRLLNVYGTDLGVVHLAEVFLRSDPLQDGDLNRLREFIREEIQKIAGHFQGHHPTQMVCTAGTPTTLAAAHLRLFPYDPEQVHNFRLSHEQISTLFEELRALPLVERRKLPWIEEGRADLILPGAQIILVAMEVFEIREMIVSDNGLREGTLLHTLKKGNK